MIPGPKGFISAARRTGATVRNAAEVLRHGGLQIEDDCAPYEIVLRRRMYRLRRYFPDEPVDGNLPAMVLVAPLMFTADSWDLSPRSSAVRALHAAGIDTWVVDFGRPESEPGGLERTMTEHILALSDVVDEVGERIGRDVMLSGYSQGGMFSYQTTAYRRGEGIDSVVTFGSPVDTRAPLPFPLSPETAARLAQGALDSGLLKYVSSPRWVNIAFFKLLDPVQSARGELHFLRQLHDRESLLPRERQRRYLEWEGYTAYPGKAMAELLEQFLVHNRMLEGGFAFDDRLVTLADIDRPILTFVGEADAIGHPDSVRAISRAAPQADVYEVTLPCGHFGLIGGGLANRVTWPSVAAWARWRAGEAPLPDAVVPAAEVKSTVVPTRGTVGRTLQTVTDLGFGGARTAVGTATRAQAIARESVAQLPRLMRLQGLQPDTTISLGRLLDEDARKRPNDIALLFGDRAIRQRELKHRVDSVVKGLLSVGVRHGDRVGVLMSFRPSSFSVVAAISRLGATAVLLRPDRDLEVESRLGGISWLVSDPEHATSAEPMTGVTWCVLGGGATPRRLPAHIIDLERIDPDEVAVPKWYRPNPRRANEVAFVVFTGEGTNTKAMAITNRRWALSALSTARAAGLRPSDTVYSTTPLHHSSALLMAAGGAIASGARFALASASDPDTFWQEVRRYGATHVTYTWTSLREVAYGPEHLSERHHPIRLFMGSGMPRNLWDQVLERFAPARVLEFYASAEGEAILANVPGLKVGAMGAPLPGTADVKVVAYDPEERRIISGPDGLARECRVDETGLLVARVDGSAPTTSSTLRSLFARDDAWQSTGDLFTRDRDGDLWLVDPVESLIRTSDELVSPSRIRNLLTSIPGVDLAVVYGVPADDEETIAAAISLLDGAELDASELDSAIRSLDPHERPPYVQVVSEIPLTTWSRPLLRPFRDAGLPLPGHGPLWPLADDGETYVAVTVSDVAA
jgi:putative long chain acyl-CoA synthase